jgi:hypothetical protein
MSETPFTLIDESRAIETAARVADGRVTLSPEAVQMALGWELKPAGLCRGKVCIPVRDGRIDASGIDLDALANALGRPLVLDADHSVAALGASADARRAQFATLDAPDFELPDLSGKLHRLSDHVDKKVLLVAYASW